MSLDTSFIGKIILEVSSKNNLLDAMSEKWWTRHTEKTCDCTMMTHDTWCMGMGHFLLSPPPLGLFMSLRSLCQRSSHWEVLIPRRKRYPFSRLLIVDQKLDTFLHRVILLILIENPSLSARILPRWCIVGVDDNPQDFMLQKILSWWHIVCG